MVENTTINGDLAKFLLQYPEFENCTITTLDDQKDRRDVKLTRVFSEFDLEKLNELNKQGAGIFFSVNSMEQGKRSQSALTKIVSYVCDIDEISKEEQWELVNRSPIKPSAVVESKNSLHLYFFAIDGTIENYKKIGTGLVQFFNGDPKVCKDPATLLRIPGFLHQKDPSDPFQVKLVYLDHEVLYTEEQMITAFPIREKELIDVKAYDGDYVPGYTGIWAEISKWNNEQMLRDLSGKSIINGDIIGFKRNTDGTRQIVINGKLSGAWIDHKGLIGSHSKGGPTWIQRVLWYKSISKHDLLRYIKDNYAHRLDSVVLQKYAKEFYLVKGKVIPSEFAQYLKESECFEGIESNLFKYDANEGLWKHLNDNEVSQIIMREGKEFLNLIFNKAELESILKFLKVHAESSMIRDQIQAVNQNDICLSDGILSVIDRSIRPYRSQEYKFSKFPYKSTEIKDYEIHLPQRFLVFLSEIFASYEDIESMIRYMQELVGFLLLPKTKGSKIHIFKGGGRNGKGKLIEAIVNMLGESNVCTIDLTKLEDVDLEKLHGKYLAVDTDTSDNIRLDQGTIRKITEGESIEARKRYGHPFTFKPFVRIILSANIDPTIKHMDTNMARRIIYIPFREIFKDRCDPDLGEKLKKESLGIFIRSLRGLKRLLESGGFVVPDEIQRETDQYLSKFKSVGRTNPVDSFLDSISLVPGDAILPKNTIYMAYLDYCKKEGISGRLGKQQLTRVLWNHGFVDKNNSSSRGFGVNMSLLKMTSYGKGDSQSQQDISNQDWVLDE